MFPSPRSKGASPTEERLGPPRRGTPQATAQWISAAISCAVQNHSGLLFVHSHPDPSYPLGLSSLDLESFETLATHLSPTMDGPFAAAVVHPHGWAGVVWSGGRVVPIDRIFGVGRNLQFLSPISVQPDVDAIDQRQKSALGIVHDRIRSIGLAVVGCGGTGSPSAEQAVRMGVADLTIVDKGNLDTPSNVRRVFGSRRSDLKTTPQPKVNIVGRHLEELQLGTRINQVAGDVTREQVFRHLLDSDVVICATDDHSSRALLNELATTYMLPVIDVGVRAGSKNDDSLCALVVEVRTLTPATPCLWCRKIIDGQVIREERLPEEERRKLAREGYLSGSFGVPEPSVVALTVLGSGLAMCALLTLLSEEGEVAPSGYWVDGFFGDARETDPKIPIEGCRCRSQVGLGDSAAPPFAH